MTAKHIAWFKEGVSEDRIETHCIIVTLPNSEALPRYLEHPDHVPVADALVADIEELRVMDLDLGSPSSA